MENRAINFSDPTGHCKGRGMGGGGCQVVGGQAGFRFSTNISQEVEAALPGFLSRNTNVDYYSKAGNAALTVVSFLPIVGEGIDAFDIGVALINGNVDEAVLIATLAAAPGRASAVLETGADGLRRLGFSDEAVEMTLRIAGNGCNFNSFEAGTLVMTDEGPVPIEEIQVGSMVLAYNETTGEIGYYPVTALISHIDIEVVYLSIDGETLVTTADHPFYTEEGVWLEAGELQIGDDIRTATWTTGEVESIYFVTQPQPMYNFTVATAHTYFVGDGQWLVHNNGLCSKLSVDDLGIIGNISQFDATFSLFDDAATIRIDMIEGTVDNPLEVFTNAVNYARSHGASTLRIEGSLANEKLLGILQRRYGFTSSGADDFIEIILDN